MRTRGCCAAAGVEAVALCGSLPPGVPVGAYAQLIREAHGADVPVLLDTSGEPLRRGLAARPDLVKPNAVELAGITGTTDPLRAARAAQRRGAHAVGASLGPRRHPAGHSRRRLAGGPAQAPRGQPHRCGRLRGGGTAVRPGRRAALAGPAGSRGRPVGGDRTGADSGRVRREGPRGAAVTRDGHGARRLRTGLSLITEPGPGAGRRSVQLARLQPDLVQVEVALVPCLAGDLEGVLALLEVDPLVGLRPALRPVALLGLARSSSASSAADGARPLTVRVELASSPGTP